jgi:hypothetical protein
MGFVEGGMNSEHLSETTSKRIENPVYFADYFWRGYRMEAFIERIKALLISYPIQSAIVLCVGTAAICITIFSFLPRYTSTLLSPQAAPQNSSPTEEAAESPTQAIPEDPTCKDFSDAYGDAVQKAAYVSYINQQFAQQRMDIITARKIIPPKLFANDEMLQRWYDECIASPDMKLSVPISMTYGIYVTTQCGMGGC